jgi:multiple antibiotic resistance protein
MPELINYAVLSFSALFSILTPFSTVPTFLTITEGNTVDERLHMIKIASCTIMAVLSGFAIVGPWIFDLFQVTASAFKAAGGVILLRAGLDMVYAQRPSLKETEAERKEGIEKDNIAVTPLAIPMLAGPGSMVTVILLSNQAANTLQHLTLLINIILISFITFFVLRATTLYSWFLSAITIRIIGRIMGLLLSVIAMQFLFNGIADFIRDIVLPMVDQKAS